MERATDAAQHAADIAARASYVSAGGTAFFGLTLNEIGVAVGIVVTIATAAVNWYYRHKHYLLAVERANFDGAKDD